MTDYEETRRRRKRVMPIKDKPRTKNIFFTCPDVNCNHCATVIAPINWKGSCMCEKCGKEMKRV